MKKILGLEELIMLISYSIYCYFVANATGTLNPAQLQYIHQQALARRQMKVLHQTASTQQTNTIQQIGVAQQVTANKLAPVTLASIQVSTSQQRPQLTVCFLFLLQVNHIYKFIYIAVCIGYRKANDCACRY